MNSLDELWLLFKFGEPPGKCSCRLQHALDDPAELHIFEATPPAFERLYATDERQGIQATRGKKRHHAFPDRVVVTETALQPDSFLHQRIERKRCGRFLGES